MAAERTASASYAYAVLVGSKGFLELGIYNIGATSARMHLKYGMHWSTYLRSGARPI